jgi:serine phosphatase RsbU (regulator of sigma subunit)
MQVSYGQEAERCPRVLVVEGNARKREQIRRAFARRGYRVEAAEDECEALAKVRQTPFEVALLSAHVTPDTSGEAGALEPPPAPGAPRSAAGGRRPTAESVKRRLMGIRPEMVCLVLNQRAYQRAAMPAQQIISLTERLLRERALKARDRRLAQRLEDTLLPQPLFSLPEFEIACVYDPATVEDGLGGDFFDFFPLPSGRLGLLLGDVAGRGLEAAPFTAMARYYARAYAHQHESAAWVLGEVNRALERDTPEEMFVTLFFGILDPPSRRLLWASAGHDAPLLLDPAPSSLPISASPRRPVSSLLPTGAALGILPGATYREECVRLPPGSLLLLYTDGVTDPWARHGEWETTPLERLLLAHAERPAEEVSREIMAAMRAEAGTFRGDDASLIVIRGR